MERTILARTGKFQVCWIRNDAEEFYSTKAEVMGSNWPFIALFDLGVRSMLLDDGSQYDLRPVDQ